MKTIEGSHYRPDLTYRKADLHLHSNFSYDVLNLPELSPRALYDTAVARGMGFFTLTDHETLKGYHALRADLEREYGDHPPIPLISGVEIKVSDRAVGHTIHVNVLGLDQRDLGQLARRRRSLDAFLDYCRERDLYHAYNHPFWFEQGERGSQRVIDRLVERFPIVELNAGRIPQLNGRALHLARKHGRNVIAASDSHTGRVARAYTEAPGETAEEFLRNIRLGVSRAVPHDASFREFMREVRSTIDLVFVRQSAFTPKRTFLRQKPLARWIACSVLRNETLMGPRKLKIGVQRGVEMLAITPAYGFILAQRRMHSMLEEIEQL